VGNFFDLRPLFCGEIRTGSNSEDLGLDKTEGDEIAARENDGEEA
jgi:hypothetical protein